MSTLSAIEVALSELAPEELCHVEKMLHRLRQRAETDEKVAQLEQRNGFDVLPMRAGELVTVEAVRQLCAEEGI